MTPIDRIEAVKSDREHGAMYLAREAAEALLELPENARVEAAFEMAKSQPAMAPLENLRRQLEANPDGGTLVRYLEVLAHSERSIGQRAADLSKVGAVVLTYSASGTVREVLEAIRPSLVLCMESLPEGEGTAFATELNHCGLKSEVIPDADALGALKHASLVLVGADAVLTSEFVNKSGTKALAEAARDASVPFYVVTATLKCAPPGWEPLLGGLFERIPRALATAIITEDGEI